MTTQIINIDKNTQKSENIIVSDYGTSVIIKTGTGKSIEINSEQIAALKLMLANIQ